MTSETTPTKASPHRQQLNISNLHCQGCANTIEAAFNAMSDIESVAVDVATKRMSLTTVLEDALVIARLKELGYEAAVGPENTPAESEPHVCCRNRSTPA